MSKTMSKTAASTITDRQISNLSNEAGAAGDSKMVAICDRALNGSARARAACAKAIRAAQAMA